MNTRRTPRHLLAAVLIGVLVGGGLMAVTPAGAEVAQAATSWKKIWKKHLQPQADKRYYKKKVANRKFARKSALANFYTKGESDARYQAKGDYAAAGSSYTKAESDAKYALKPAVIRGTYAMETTGAAGTIVADNIPFGVTLSAAPVAHYIESGTAPPAGCSGNAAAPNAQPGHLCVFEALNNNGTNQRLFSAVGAPGLSSPFGINVAATGVAAGNVYVYGSWAVAPTGFAAAAGSPLKAPQQLGAVEGK